MSATIIFSALKLGKTIAEYTGLIESVGANVTKLVHAPFKSAMANLKDAAMASEANREFYIREALKEFTTACQLEENENLVSAILGKAMCQHLLKDYLNRDMTIKQIDNVELTLPEKTKAIARGALRRGFGANFVVSAILDAVSSDGRLNSRKNEFAQFKTKALSVKYTD